MSGGDSFGFGRSQYVASISIAFVECEIFFEYSFEYSFDRSNTLLMNPWDRRDVDRGRCALPSNFLKRVLYNRLKISTPIPTNG